ncbi:LpqB family beta-propeller domain-containing protein [Cryobacterium roopkundense]|uniref:LpqB family beta-propeller domain-containing protein n=1 Tax=Cryobacterium roopkundense TaxID=1001240 RepID=UPI001269B4A1|nr:LpqB family beta-propeller domain-containing protein [Cryobacterium roopkundense]
MPDLRWFPRGASAPTKIVNAVLSGPSAWLVGAVATTFPEGTALTADAVQVVGRDAMVDLNTEALNADRLTLQRMKAQLTASLPAGMQVEITIDQNAQNIQDLGAGDLAVNPRVDARALILRDGAFGFLAASGQTVTPVDGISDAVVALNPTAVTLGSGQRVAVVLTPDGVYRVRAGNEPTLVDSRPGLIAPSLDSEGYSWSVPASRPSELLVFGSTTEAIPVLTPWPEATSIQTMKVSRDGTRLLVVYTIGAEARMAVAGIKRQDGVPVELGAPLQLTGDIGAPLDAAWIDELSVASLSTIADGTRQITAQEIGGVRSELESPPDAVALAGQQLASATCAPSPRVAACMCSAGWVRQKRLDEVSLLATQQGITG